ncbi:unnamed protein product, partial [Cuscuta epithymum]
MQGSNLGKLFIFVLFSFRSTYFYFSSSGYGWSILIFDKLLIGSVSFSVVLGFFLPVLCLASQVALYGLLTLSYHRAYDRICNCCLDFVLHVCSILMKSHF